MTEMAEKTVACEGNCGKTFPISVLDDFDGGAHLLLVICYDCMKQGERILRKVARQVTELKDVNLR